MLNLIDWNDKIRVNGKVYPNSNEAYADLKDYDGELIIELNFKEVQVGEYKIEGDTIYF